MMEIDEKVAVLSIMNNLALSAIKLGLSFLSGSIALIADAIHSFTDVIASLTVLAGLRISRRTSKTFPYGLYKVENLVSLLTAFAIFFAGYKIVKEVFSQEAGAALDHLPIALAGVIVTIGMTFAFSRYELRVGRRIGSPSLVADAQHVRTDMLSSVAIFVGLAGHMFGLHLDRIAALVVVLFIAKAGWEVMVDAVRVLLDASLDFETLDRVKSLLLEESKIQAINGLWGRSSGRYKFIEADITIAETRFERAHQVAGDIEERIKGGLANVDHILIHYAPIEKEILTYAIPLAERKGTVSPHFGEAPFFMFIAVRTKDDTIVLEDVRVNPHTELERGKGIKVAEWLIENDVDVVCLKERFEGKGPTYVFGDADVEVRVTEMATAGEIMEEILS